MRGVGLYKKGWAELVEHGHAEPYLDLENQLYGVKSIVVMAGNKHIGILAYQFYENCPVPEIYVQLAYVSPEYRSQGYFKLLNNQIKDVAKTHGVPFIYWNVHNHNYRMRQILRKQNAVTEYVTYRTDSNE